MDTHITTAPDIDERVGAPLGSPIRLPGGRGTLPHLEDHDLGPSSDVASEAEIDGSPTPEAREKLIPTTTARSRRKGLLSTVAVLVVLAGIGGVAWAERQGALHLPLPPQMVALLRTGLPVSSQVVGEIGVKPARVPTAPPASARPDPDQSARANRQQAEFAALKMGDTATEVGIPANSRQTTPPIPMAALSVAQSAPAASVPVTTVAAVPPTVTDAGVAFTPALSPASPPPTPPVQTAAAAVTPAAGMSNVPVPAVVTTPTTAPAPSPVSTPPAKLLDPVQTASVLQAAPFSTKQQVEMVGLVRELGAQLKESRLTVSQMQATVADLKEQLDTRLTEFDGRLGLAETGTVLAQSAKAASPQPVMTAATVPTRQTIASHQTAPVAPAAPPPGSPASRSVKDFRVQGASPGLAVLNVLVAGPGEAPVLYVALGDQVPGIGRIKSIYQRGTTWVVQTDAGLIQ